MFNIEIKDALRGNRVYGYEVANKLGISEYTFSKRMARSELSDKEKEEILDVIRCLRRGAGAIEKTGD